MVYNCCLETQLKQRLTGAAILVALVVIVVPELLSGPPSDRSTAPVSTGGASDNAVELPVSGPVGEFPKPAQNGALRSYTIDLENSSRDSNPVVEASTEAVAAPLGSAIAESDTKPDSPPTAKAVEADVQPVAQPQSGGYSVQLGSFGNRDNAERLVSSMRAKGFAAYLDQSSGSRKLYRVRVGPVAERTAADALASQLAKAGQKGVVVPNS